MVLKYPHPPHGLTVTVFRSPLRSASSFGGRLHPFLPIRSLGLLGIVGDGAERRGQRLFEVSLGDVTHANERPENYGAEKGPIATA